MTNTHGVFGVKHIGPHKPMSRLGLSLDVKGDGEEGALQPLVKELQAFKAFQSFFAVLCDCLLRV